MYKHYIVGFMVIEGINKMFYDHQQQVKDHFKYEREKNE